MGGKNFVGGGCGQFNPGLNYRSLNLCADGAFDRNPAGGPGTAIMNPINEVEDVWAYLRSTPLLLLMMTMMNYLVGFRCFEKAKRSPIVSLVAVAASILGFILKITATPYNVYFEGAQFVHFF